MKYFLFVFCLLLLFTADARNRKVKIITSKGTIIVKLSNKTPLHRNNFVKLVKQGFYNGILFHRVIKDFMIQAGDDSTKQSVPGKRYGNGGLSYKIPAEFDSSLFHKRGVLAAARDNNPEKASSGSHFYIVQGKKFTDSTLNDVEVKRMGGRKIPERYRTVYKTIGGAPHLDQNYTVFGEVVKGLNVVDTIAQMERDQYDRPKEDVRIIRMKLKRKFLFF
ncbi:peptidylprolyl isomerase [Lacibacter luteus]|uniref:peptidylprolyl isomerase n=1 Tax=Lacibacter luteus TaxID=2508719 RepID=A0A4Q1CHP7_9BACT|nr:peptidylprolyl isomerase [Lacibacter luteus]RXK59866.1 peptidylprolyl isomerase [Lacibacter luteus]